MRQLKRKHELLPRWDMPTDPVAGVFWFMHWSLKVLVRYFYIAILAGVITESILNSFVGGIVTLLIGLGVWGGLAVALLFFNIGTNLSQGLSGISHMQQGVPQRNPFSDFIDRDPEVKGKVVEGTVINLEEERRKRGQDL